MASLKDVAKLANVSLMTVSRALNTPERLKPETLARVQAAIAETNYVPDLSAKKIRGARATPSTIGVLALDTVTTPFSVEITLSIEETARAHGWNSFVVNMFSDDRPEAVVDLPPLPPSGRHYLYHHGPAPGTTAGKTADSALRAGQLRKPQPAGGQLYPGR
ncbi:Sucrose specific transcriptional regulator CscR,LacI family [Klebsiella pneumoniae IS39]|nr:Sucrose specific transcriptional regulator CscR,LacI family [Klebsiella pneumoniae IS39]